MSSSPTPLSALTSLPLSPYYGPSDSDSSSATPSPTPQRNAAMSTHTTVYAEVEQHGSRPPVLKPGDITALVVRDFENTALNWFAMKNVPDEQQVSQILGSFRDTRHIAWLRPAAERSHVKKLLFDAFMAEFRNKYLPVDWQAITRNEILSSRMKETQTFDEWFTEVIGLALLLDGTPSRSV
ncbi:hypothetical protein DFH08DRAFT_819245 [Mycena albidolilacea]|uniref:Retrotransposon gag domain-containing protein n=1 Tax=Mycena albidolilacea TaxID=1033008 RepID=A0AAD7EFC2_9AGAR|nr:hypothetical protein DFH08DRAFT_819245 [Mycena albidolilacea]